MKKILVIGQTPPPYYGQALMVERLINAKFDQIEIHPLRMAFSKSSESVGKFSIGKIFHLIYIIGAAISLRLRYKIHTLYYLPAGPNKIPIIRDLLILIFIRPFFRKIIFHFRAAGLSEFLKQTNSVFRKLALLAYNRPNLSIHLSEYNPQDGKYLKSDRVVIVKNGLEDEGLNYLPLNRPVQKKLNILFVGILTESKGVMVMLEAVRGLMKEGYDLEVSIVGMFSSKRFERTVMNFCAENGMNKNVHIVGEIRGQSKWQYYAKADVFCFPTFYESESFGNVILEAMMFELPVISTQWRGIPSLVDEGVTGFLTEIKNPQRIAEKIKFLYENPEVRLKLGKKGREKYLEQFTLEKHFELMEQYMYEVHL